MKPPLVLLCLATCFIDSPATAQLPPGVWMTRPQEVLATHYTKNGHSSSFVELEGGRILQVANSTFTTSDDGGITWSAPFKNTDVEGKPVGGGGPSLVKLSGRGIGLACYRRDPNASTPEERWRSVHVVFWRSDDQGKTWQPPVRITPTLGMSTSCLQDVMIRTSSGRIVMPVNVHFGQYRGPNDLEYPIDGRLVKNQWVSTSAHFHDPTFLAVYVVYSDDDGRSWRCNKDSLLYILHDWSTGYDKVSEPSVAEVSPGRLLMVMRTSLGRLYQAWSTDNGETWTRPVGMPLAGTETPAQIRRLPTGHLLMVWNQESEEEVKRGYNRTRVSTAISRNGGSVWEFFQNISSVLPGTRVEPGPIRPVRPAQYDFTPGHPAPERDGSHLGDSDVWVRTSYPSVFVMKDRVLVAHTYSRYEEDAVKGQLYNPDSFNQVLKVIPLKWFYGGKEPAPNPQLKNPYESAKP